MMNNDKYVKLQPGALQQMILQTQHSRTEWQSLVINTFITAVHALVQTENENKIV
jgi:hypothetical protein